MKNFKLFFLNCYANLCDYFSNLRSKKVPVAGAKEGSTTTHFLLPEVEDPKPLYFVDPSDANLIISSDKRFKIRIEKFPKNPDGRDYSVSLPFFVHNDARYSYYFPSCSPYDDNDLIIPLVKKMFDTYKCKNVTVSPFCFYFMKTPAVCWSEIEPKILEILFAFLQEKYPAE